MACRGLRGQGAPGEEEGWEEGDPEETRGEPGREEPTKAWSPCEAGSWGQERSPWEELSRWRRQCCEAWGLCEAGSHLAGQGQVWALQSSGEDHQGAGRLTRGGDKRQGGHSGQSRRQRARGGRPRAGCRRASPFSPHGPYTWCQDIRLQVGTQAEGPQRWD